MYINTYLDYQYSSIYPPNVLQEIRKDIDHKKEKVQVCENLNQNVLRDYNLKMGRIIDIFA